MKKFFSFFAMAAFMTFMVACGGNDNENKDGEANDDKGSVENVANESATNVQKAISLTEDMLKIMEQEPSAEVFEAMMTMTKQVQDLSGKLTKEEEKEIEAYMNEKYPEMMNPEFMDEKTVEMQQKWANWGMEHQAEAEAIAKKVMGE